MPAVLRAQITSQAIISERRSQAKKKEKRQGRGKRKREGEKKRGEIRWALSGRVEDPVIFFNEYLFDDLTLFFWVCPQRVTGNWGWSRRFFLIALLSFRLSFLLISPLFVAEFRDI